MTFPSSLLLLPNPILHNCCLNWPSGRQRNLTIGIWMQLMWSVRVNSTCNHPTKKKSTIFSKVACCCGDHRDLLWVLQTDTLRQMQSKRHFQQIIHGRYLNYRTFLVISLEQEEVHQRWKDMAYLFTTWPQQNLLENGPCVYDKEMRDNKHCSQQRSSTQEHRRNQTLLTDLTFKHTTDRSQ